MYTAAEARNHSWFTAMGGGSTRRHGQRLERLRIKKAMGLTGCTETSVPINLRCVTPQKSDISFTLRRKPDIVRARCFQIVLTWPLSLSYVNCV